jgi:hypothetical protein
MPVPFSSADPAMSLCAGRILFADDLHDNVAAAGPGIEIHDDDLLPGAERRLLIDKGYGQRLTLNLSAQVAVAVVFTRIAGVVLPFRIDRD